MNKLTVSCDFPLGLDEAYRVMALDEAAEAEAAEWAGNPIGDVGDDPSIARVR